MSWGQKSMTAHLETRDVTEGSYPAAEKQPLRGPRETIPVPAPVFTRNSWGGNVPLILLRERKRLTALMASQVRFFSSVRWFVRKWNYANTSNLRSNHTTQVQVLSNRDQPGAAAALKFKNGDWGKCWSGDFLKCTLHHLRFPNPYLPCKSRVNKFWNE